MRVTVCELPHGGAALVAAWAALCEHTRRHASELVLLPELAMVEPFWEESRFDPERWALAERVSAAWMGRLGELGAQQVVGTRPVTMDGRRYNQGYLASDGAGVVPLRRKYLLPDEPGSWEARWFDSGDPGFPPFHAGELSFGLHICTELWAVERWADYAAREVQVILSPRATAAATTAKWLSAGVVAAVRSGAFSVSSNRVDPGGICGGVGWIIGPDGDVLVTTSAAVPFVTVDLDLATAAAARKSYPRYVFQARPGAPAGPSLRSG
jgi:N-carbamoylputrescine amidase